MPRRPRNAPGGIVYHVLNRAVGRNIIFEDDLDFAAFEKVLSQACERYPGVGLLAYCFMDNHWHLVLRPEKSGQLSDFLRWLTVTHTQRWHAYHETSGTGPLYQGRFKSFPVQSDRHLRIVGRYVERNAVRAGLARSARNWQWSSAWWRQEPEEDDAPPRKAPSWLTGPMDWPTEARPRSIREWDAFVDREQTAAEVAALELSMKRGVPFGDEAWTKRTAGKLSLESSLRPMHRPKGSKDVKKRQRRSGTTKADR